MAWVLIRLPYFCGYLDLLLGVVRVVVHVIVCWFYCFHSVSTCPFWSSVFLFVLYVWELFEISQMSSKWAGGKPWIVWSSSPPFRVVMCSSHFSSAPPSFLAEWSLFALVVL